MIKVVFLAVFSLTAASVVADNLIKNSDMDEKNFRIEYRNTANPKHISIAPFTEDLTWNKCMRLRLEKFLISGGKRKVNGGILCGGEKTVAGFKVKPDTVYKFSLELKGNAPTAFISAVEWSGPEYYKDRSSIKTSVGAVKVMKDWVKYSGTFKTTGKAKRAALHIQIWGNEKNMPYKEGDFLLLDKLSIEEQSLPSLQTGNQVRKVFVPVRKAVNAQFVHAAPDIDGKLTDAAWTKSIIANDFLDYKTGKPALNQTSVRLLAGPNNLYLAITCQDPQPKQVKASYNGVGGSDIWKDDAVEIFFGPVAGDRQLSQFVVGAGGGRWMGNGNASVSGQYDKWQVAVIRNESGWQAEVKIPYELIGYSASPKVGNFVAFEVCRQRKLTKEYSAWTFVKGNFHNVKEYGLLVFGDYSAWLKSRASELNAALGVLPESPQRGKLKKAVAALAKKNQLSSNEFEKLVQQTEQLSADIKYLKFKNRKYVFGPISPVADMTVPMLPAAVFNPPDKIVVRAAVNEFKPVPVAILNLTDKTAAYRIFAYSAMNDGIEVPGLAGLPADKLTIREAVRVKDSDSDAHGLMNDPLPRINEAYTITVPPKQTGLVWLTLDCRGLKPGNYTSALRVIPLSEPGKFTLSKGWHYQGAMQDMPLSLEVLPITLPSEPAIPLWLMRRAGTESFFISMIEHGNRVFQLSPWSFTMKFDANGKVIDASMPKLDKTIRKHLDWSRKYHVGIKFLVGFSAYDVFNKVHLKGKNFKVGSAAWQNAWKNWLRGVEKAFTKQGLNPGDVTIETFDEPHEGTGVLLYAVSKAAKESGVKMAMQITVGARKPKTAQFEKLLPLVDEWCMWGAHFDNKEMLGFIKRIKGQGKKLSFYYCNTNMRASLSRYYRRHAWIGKYYGCSTIGLFTLLNGPGGYYGRASWKTACSGAVVYNSMGQCIPSIRYEALRLGVTDLQYLKVLENLIVKAEKTGKAAVEAKRAKKFIADATRQVAIVQAHDPKAAPNARAQAVKLILELQKKLQ